MNLKNSGLQIILFIGKLFNSTFTVFKSETSLYWSVHCSEFFTLSFLTSNTHAYASLAACWFSSQAEKLYAKSKPDFLLWLTWLPGTEVLIHIRCVQGKEDREKSQYAEHQFAWTRLELLASQLPLFQCLNVIWKLIEFRRRHRFLRPLSSFPPFSDPHLWKCPFSSTPGLQGLSFWASECWVILPNPATVYLKHLGSETTCAGTILLHTLPEWTVKMFLTHTAMEEMLCSTSWKYS